MVEAIILIVGMPLAIPFALLCLSVRSFLIHKSDIEDRKLKVAVMENSKSAWEEFDVKYREQFEFDAGRQ